MNTYILERETAAAKRFRDRLALEFGDDDDMLRDMIEGETNLHGLLSRAIFELAATEGEQEGIKAAVEKMVERHKRKGRQVEALRDAIFAAMEVAGLQKHQAPAGTASIRMGKPKVEVIDESMIPAEYKTTPAPVVNKAAVKAALEHGAEVPGAALSNVAPVLAIRLT